MSDAYYQERARQRTRRLLIVGGAIVLVACAALGVASLFYDACTGSFDRAPEDVVRTYLEAVRAGNAPVAQECWEQDAYFDLETGCSEVCLAKVYGASYEIVEVRPGPVVLTAAGRSNLPVEVTVACTGSQEEHAAQIMLDSVGGDPPWKHWAIVHSTFGGSVADPWCK